MSKPIIKQIHLQLFKLELNEPFVTTAQSIRSRTGIVIQVIDQYGNMGFGESTPLFGFDMGGIIYTARSLKRMQRLLIGVEIASLEDITNLLLPYNLPPAANHGIELALLNLLASSHHKKLAQLLHGDYRPRVAINGLIGQVAPEAAAQKAQILCELGYTCLKVKVGDDLDLQRVQAIRSIANSFAKQTKQEIKIRIDANQAWTVAKAIQKLHDFTELDIEYAEQPVSANNLLGMAEVRNSVKIAIAADESVKNIQGLQQVIDSQAVSIVILKPMALGGILTTLKAAKVAIASGLEVVITHTLDGAIAQLGALHLAAMPEISRHCGLGSTLFANELLTPEGLVKDGLLKTVLTQELTVKSGEIYL